MKRSTLGRGFVGALVLGVLLSIDGRQVQAQSPLRDLMIAMRSDSTAWQHVLAYVIGRLSTEILRAAADTNAQPWELRLPAADPQRSLVEAQLRHILRVRSIRPTDTLTHTLEIGELRVVRDTASVEVSVSVTQRCPGTTRTTGSRWMETVQVERHELGWWGQAFSRVTEIGDRLGC
jgi:hypothetical protein